MTHSFLISFISGIFLVLVAAVFLKKRQLQKIRKTAEEIAQSSQEKVKLLREDTDRQISDHKEELLADLEKIHAPLMEQIEEAKVHLEAKEEDLKQVFQFEMSNYNSKKQSIESKESNYNNKKETYSQKSKTIQKLQKEYIQMIESQIKEPLDEFKNKIQNNVEEDFQDFLLKKIKRREDNFNIRLEDITLSMILRALNRFSIPHCPERGIQNIEFRDQKTLIKVLGPDQKHLSLIGSLIGVDLSVTETEDKISLNVSAFDMVRRELTRIVCEQLIKDKTVDERRVKTIVERKKNELFKKILSDGRAMAEKLNLKNVHPEILRFMGCLRYRYSFTQNQYFHCSEVGWLCGLLSEELKLDKQKARRAGWLHDLGKSMDHSLSGGHAVIGAEFIQKHGEADDIVHAVKAHHYDEEPQAPLDFLVIGADALSGARPGARRSTTEFYTQKLEQLHQVTKDLEGVESSQILSAGRELRVYVDSQKIKDQEALEMSKKIALKIEDEMKYPGYIKVTVVRRSMSTYVSNKAQ